MTPKKTIKKTPKKSMKKALTSQVKKEVPVAVKTPVTEKKHKVYEISAFTHTLIIFIIAFLYIEIAAVFYIDYNYEVFIESKAQIRARQFKRHRNILLQRRLRMRKRMEQQKASNKCPKAVARRVPFNEAEYTPYDEGGNAVIEGSLCFELNDGTTKCFENSDVFINPVTTYSDEWYNRGWAGREYLQNPDERALKFNKMIKSGKDGIFKFTGLKPGSYYVGASVCLPEGKDKPNCQCTRYAAKVTMKNRVKTTLKKVSP